MKKTVFFAFLIGSFCQCSTRALGGKPNHLIHEQSPYLLQHAYNSVDWYPWGKQAFEKAKRENKPIYLSIGYSTCHWCHVMEKESFNDPEIGAYLNKHFVCIKVDREERPDIDQIYLRYVQQLLGNAGWPLNVFLTPDLEPFFGGTYFPPHTQKGRIGLLELSFKLQKLWAEDSESVIKTASIMRKQLLASTEVSEDLSHHEITELSKQAADYFLRNYDPEFGGFNPPPKFPMPVISQFLLNYALLNKNPSITDKVVQTCKKMALGSIHDHLGGGFSRYATDREWNEPHFEKMLYDNAQLISLYVDIYLLTRESDYLRIAEETADYVFRELSNHQGAYFSAQDAQSEGVEGKYYTWSWTELEDLLTEDQLHAVAQRFSMTKKGNFSAESPNTKPTGTNLLKIQKEEALYSSDTDLLSALTVMKQERQKRIKPLIDQKVISSWNALMLSAHAKLYGVTQNQMYRERMLSSIRFLKAQLWNEKEKQWHHRWMKGETDKIQLLKSYSFVLASLIDAYESTLEPAVLDFAITTAQKMIDKFYDPNGGGFWFVQDDESLIIRYKNAEDSAEPAASSVALFSLSRLYAITEIEDFRQILDRSIDYYASEIESEPQGYPHLIQALMFNELTPKRVVIVAKDPKVQQKLLEAVHSNYLPNRVVLGTKGKVEPFAKTLSDYDGPDSVFVCSGSECSLPTNDPEQIARLLKTGW